MEFHRCNFETNGYIVLNFVHHIAYEGDFVYRIR